MRLSWDLLISAEVTSLAVMHDHEGCLLTLAIISRQSCVPSVLRTSEKDCPKFSVVSIVCLEEVPAVFFECMSSFLNTVSTRKI